MSKRQGGQCLWANADDFLLKGFSLLELLITLVVICVLVSISVPAIRNQLIENRLRAAAETFVQTAQMARSEALMRQQDVYINVQTGASWCYGVNVASSCSCSPVNNCTSAYILGSRYPEVVVSNTGFTGGLIHFSRARGINNVASSVTLTIGSRLITVTLSQLGNFSLCSTGVSGYSAC